MRREPDSQREAVHQPNIHIYPLLFGFPSPSGHHRALRRAPCAQQFLISYPFYVCASTQCQLSQFNSLQPHGLQPARLFYPLDFPGKNTGICCHFLLQETFLIQGSNLVSCSSCIGRQILYHRVTQKAHLFYTLYQ